MQLHDQAWHEIVIAHDVTHKIEGILNFKRDVWNKWEFI
jgi:hypothetical protein